MKIKRKIADRGEEIYSILMSKEEARLVHETLTETYKKMPKIFETMPIRHRINQMRTTIGMELIKDNVPIKNKTRIK